MAENALESINTGKLGLLLQQARKQCGLTQADVAQILDVARTTIVAIEKGDRRIKPGELIKLARTYGKAVSDFLGESPASQPFIVQFRSAYNQTETEDSELKSCIALLEKLCRSYGELEKICGSPLPQNYPQDYQVEGMPTESAAESIAIAERSRLGLGDGPIHFLRDVLEQGVGLRIFYLTMASKYSEIYGYDENLGGCMAVNANHIEERRRWSLAHGYLHFLAHRRKAVVDFDGQYKRIPESERLAEAFPKYFLMPTSGLLKRFNDMYRSHGKFTPTNLFTLAHYYGVSIQALVYRLEEMELLPTATWDKLSARGLKVSKVKQELGIKEIPQRTERGSTHYQHLAIDALDQGLITEGRFAAFLGVDRLEARRIAESLQEHSSGSLDDSTHWDLRQA